MILEKIAAKRQNIARREQPRLVNGDNRRTGGFALVRRNILRGIRESMGTVSSTENTEMGRRAEPRTSEHPSKNAD
jgi:hypothetical protein